MATKIGKIPVKYPFTDKPIGKNTVGQPNRAWIEWFEQAQAVLSAISQSGTTANRPPILFVGQRYYDTTLDKAVYVNAAGTAWITGIDAANVPLFGAYQGTNQTITTQTHTKCNIDTEEFDSHNYYDTTNKRFLPLIEGYYQCNWQIGTSASTTLIRMISYLYKNGAVHKRGGDVSTGIVGYSVGGSALVYLNGSTDYVEVWAYLTATTPKVTAGASVTYLNGHLVAAS